LRVKKRGPSTKREEGRSGARRCATTAPGKRGAEYYLRVSKRGDQAAYSGGGRRKREKTVVETSRVTDEEKGGRMRMKKKKGDPAPGREKGRPWWTGRGGKHGAVEVGKRRRRSNGKEKRDLVQD